MKQLCKKKKNVSMSKLLSWKIPKDSNSIFITHWTYFKGLWKREEGIGKNINLLMSPWRFLIEDYMQTCTHRVLSTKSIITQRSKPDCLGLNLGSDSSYLAVPQLSLLSSKNKNRTASLGGGKEQMNESKMFRMTSLSGLLWNIWNLFIKEASIKFK